MSLQWIPLRDKVRLGLDQEYWSIIWGVKRHLEAKNSELHGPFRSVFQWGAEMEQVYHPHHGSRLEWGGFSGLTCPMDLPPSPCSQTLQWKIRLRNTMLRALCGRNIEKSESSPDPSSRERENWCPHGRVTCCGISEHSRLQAQTHHLPWEILTPLLALVTPVVLKGTL